jgi:hypothetical protein
MNFNLASLAPYTRIAAVVLGLVIVYLVVRFLWRHVIVFILRIGAGILVIVAILAVLRYFKVF